jgi:Ca2+-binding EF-hand superfamily protein
MLTCLQHTVNLDFLPVKTTKEIVHAQVKQGFRKRSSQEIKRVFDHYADGDHTAPSTLHLPKDKLLVAMKEFSVGSRDITNEDLSNLEFLFSSLDQNCDGNVDLYEFTHAVQKPSHLEEWVRSLNIHQLVADAIPRKEGEDALITASKLSSQAISDICTEIVEGLQILISDGVKKLRQGLECMEAREVNKLAVKFQSKAPKLNCGSMEDFRLGIMAHIGTHPRCFISPRTIASFPHTSFRLSCNTTFVT